MIEQLALLEDESYSLDGIEKKCYEFIRKKNPRPVFGETLEEYNDFLKEEAELELVYRLRKIADERERRILEPQKQAIHEIYGE